MFEYLLIGIGLVLGLGVIAIGVILAAGSAFGDNKLPGILSLIGAICALMGMISIVSSPVAGLSAVVVGALFVGGTVMVPGNKG